MCGPWPARWQGPVPPINPALENKGSAMQINEDQKQRWTPSDIHVHSPLTGGGTVGRLRVRKTRWRSRFSLKMLKEKGEGPPPPPRVQVCHAANWLLQGRETPFLIEIHRKSVPPTDWQPDGEKLLSQSNQSPTWPSRDSGVQGGRGGRGTAGETRSVESTMDSIPLVNFHPLSGNA
ncbi:hypothetical protein EYF80_011919 [Liparis tanakae]|uniref:Uncharacterized protein n=1 Tax=Liparis tanakae TaxID=230148 RepID=A0A4Z2IKV2_9TELE|nr:hypothetical protein EYF80_011919 [Liparis tanakae]